MNIYTVRDNLIKTIEGKQAYLEEVRKAREQLATVEGAGANAQDSALFATQEFLKINIVELTKILKDVTECCTIATEQSWIGVDRQGGI
jgi:hypothetical protein